MPDHSDRWAAIRTLSDVVEQYRAAECELLGTPYHPRRRCEHCGRPLAAGSRSDRRYCGKNCREAGWERATKRERRAA